MHMQRFDSLDTLRGICAILVAAFHFIPVTHGYLAVDFFIILSGFVLTHSFRKNPEKLSHFIIKRFLRIYPLTLVCLLIYTGIYFVFSAETPKKSIDIAWVQHFFLIQNIGLPPEKLSWNYPDWSSCVEFWVSIILFPMILVKTNRILIQMTLILCGFYFICFINRNLDTNSINFFSFVNSGLMRGVLDFSLGIIGYNLKNQIKKINKSSITEYLFFTFLILILTSQIKAWQFDILCPLFFMLTISIFSQQEKQLSKILSKLNVIGKISYPMYLIQATILIFFEIKPRDTYHFLIYISITTIASVFLYFIVEKPTLQLRGKIIKNIKTRQSNATSLF